RPVGRGPRPGGRAARTGEGSRVGATWRTLVRPASSRPSTVDPRPWARPAGRGSASGARRPLERHARSGARGITERPLPGEARGDHDDRHGHERGGHRPRPASELRPAAGRTEGGGGRSPPPAGQGANGEMVTVRGAAAWLPMVAASLAGALGPRKVIDRMAVTELNVPSVGSVFGKLRFTRLPLAP